MGTGTSTLYWREDIAVKGKGIRLLQATKKSIAADPGFKLYDFSHCIAHHICKAAGKPITGRDVKGEGHVDDVARSLAGLPDDSLFYLIMSDAGNMEQEKKVALKAIDKLIAQRRAG